jgi:Histidine kinase-, DNA gyrase B-, and HSP90-like ATPase
MESFVIKPRVDAAQEFVEIATDFSNPLDLVREAISNSLDAKATEVRIEFSTVRDAGENVLITEITDNGLGMNNDGLQAFFDLGNSLRRNDPSTIGEKGHGTKVYFNSSEIEVLTTQNGKTYRALMEQPFKSLHRRDVPSVNVTEEETKNPQGTKIRIKGYNNNRRDRFQQNLLKDYVVWFTKFGSVEGEFGVKMFQNARLFLKGLDVEKAEEISFGHFFPPQSASINKLFDEYLVDAPEYYCRKITKQGNLRNFPELKYQAVLCIEGNKIKAGYNPMLRKAGSSKGQYKVQDRYGLWLCKDFIPVQRANEWIGVKGTEYTRFHAFLNCQGFHLTANRGTVNNTPSEILEDLRTEVEEIYSQITNGQDWRDLEYLESQVSAYRNTEREKRDFEDRKKKFNKSSVATFKGQVIAAPQHESGVFALVTKLTTLDPSCFPFEILDYNTYQGYDLLVKGDQTTPIQQSQVFYVELKNILGPQLNHSFKHLKSIVAWDTSVKNGGEITDINDEARTLQVITPAKAGDTTKYFLDHPSKGIKVEVYVLKDYLAEKYKLEFRPRASDQTV